MCAVLTRLHSVGCVCIPAYCAQHSMSVCIHLYVCMYVCVCTTVLTCYTNIVHFVNCLFQQVFYLYLSCHCLTHTYVRTYTHTHTHTAHTHTPHTPHTHTHRTHTHTAHRTLMTMTMMTMLVRKGTLTKTLTLTTSCRQTVDSRRSASSSDEGGEGRGGRTWDKP